MDACFLFLLSFLRLLLFCLSTHLGTRGQSVAAGNSIQRGGASAGDSVQDANYSCFLPDHFQIEERRRVRLLEFHDLLDLLALARELLCGDCITNWAEPAWREEVSAFSLWDSAATTSTEKSVGSLHGGGELHVGVRVRTTV